MWGLTDVGSGFSVMLHVIFSVIALLVPMVLLRAFLLGDVARLVFAADACSQQYADDEDVKSIGYILKRNFGKVIEVGRF